MLDAKICGAVSDFDAEVSWAFEHATSMTAWLRSRAKRSDRDAVRLCATAQKLRVLPSVYAAWLDGRLSSGHVDVVEANVNRRTLRVFSEHEARLCALLEPLNIVESRRAMRRLAAAAEAIVDDGSGNTDGAARPNRLSLSRTLDGRGALSGDLDVETTELLDTALKLLDSRDLEVAPAQRRGDALAAVCRYFLDHHNKADVVAPLAGQRRNRPHLHVIVGPDGHGETEDGTPVPASVVDRLKCDARINDVRFADGQILYYGRSRRTAPDHLFDALVVRDRGCRFPGCDRPPRWTEAHHVRPWGTGACDGLTDIDELVLICGGDHDRVHQPGWQEKLLPNGVYEVTAPDGTVMTSRPPGDPDAPQRTLFPQ